MTYQSPLQQLPVSVEAGRQVARLRQVLDLVEQVAGWEPDGDGRSGALDESARFSSAYVNALPVAQRRFDALADETASWAATAVEALIAHEDSPTPPRAAAARLARELDQALVDLARLIRA